MRAAGLALVLLLAAAPAAGQDRARLDDFALPPSEQAVAIDQLPTVEAAPAEQPRDRSLAVPQPAPAPRAPLDQLAEPGEATAPSQLTARAASRRLAPAAVSSAADSRPAPAGPIGGADRCDPQALEGQDRAECLRILELRAAEFNATEAPRMSAEEKLLADQRRRDDEARPSAARRVSLAAADDPDADLVTNQEIAAIYLERDGAPPPDRSAPPPGPALPPGDLTDALQAVLPPGAVQD